MKSEAEIQRAVRHLTETAVHAKRVGDPGGAAVMLSIADALSWAIDQPNRFGANVVEPCDAIDRAGRQ